MIRAHAAGCSCCCVACKASLIARCVHAVGAWLALDSLEVVFLVWRTLASQSSLVLTGCELWLRCIAWLPCVLVELVWLVRFGGFFPEQCLGGSGGGSSRTGLRSSQDRPLSLLLEVLPKSASCLFRATVVLLLWFEVCRLVGLCSGEVLPEQLLALLVEVLPRAASRYFGCVVPLAVHLAAALANLSYGGLVSAIGVLRAVLLMGASVSRCGFASRVWKRLVRVSFLCFSSVARGGDAPLWCCVAEAGLLVQALFRCVFDCASACALEAFHSRCSMFRVLLGADVVVALLEKLSTFRVLLLWVSGRESPSVGHVSSRAIGLQFLACGFWRVSGEESFRLARSILLMLVIAPYVVPCVDLSVVRRALVVACVQFLLLWPVKDWLQRRLWRRVLSAAVRATVVGSCSQHAFWDAMLAASTVQTCANLRAALIGSVTRLVT
ncbi:hypothetical protein Taro_052188, partial [Colocasia esculenta]|nr:hypothetical protein [Colocasia esculenta]